MKIERCYINDILNEWYDIYKNYEGNDKRYVKALEELERYQRKAKKIDKIEIAKRGEQNE